MSGALFPIQTGPHYYRESQDGIYDISRAMRTLGDFVLWVTTNDIFSTLTRCPLTSTANVTAHLIYHHTLGYDTGAIAGILIAPLPKYFNIDSNNKVEQTERYHCGAAADQMSSRRVSRKFVWLQVSIMGGTGARDE